MKQDILSFLEMIGVNNRFISIYKRFIFINNLKFSKFSRRREELFLVRYPDWKVVRSKLFQKMCVRASRILSKSLKPRYKVFIEKDSSCASLALYMILEPYIRKYGIEIIYCEDLNLVMPLEFHLTASPLTLNMEVENILNQMFNGEKIESTISKDKSREQKTIYPLINIPDSWIKSWVNEYGFTCSTPPADKVSNDLLEFLGEFIPDVRENMLKSAVYLTDNKKRS